MLWLAGWLLAGMAEMSEAELIDERGSTSYVPKLFNLPFTAVASLAAVAFQRLTRPNVTSQYKQYQR